MSKVHEVEAILNHTIKDGTKWFRVKWKGFDDEADFTWEEEASLSDCSHLMYCYANSDPKSTKSTQKGEFEVDHIGGHRRRNGVTEYLVYWKGYKSKDATWEPETNIDCSALDGYVQKVLGK